MRDTFELWLIIEAEFDRFFNRSLCETISDIYEAGIISRSEQLVLCDIIREYAKKRYKFDYQRQFADFIWTAWEKKPRRMFIQKQILKAIRQ